MFTDNNVAPQSPATENVAIANENEPPAHDTTVTVRNTEIQDALLEQPVLVEQPATTEQLAAPEETASTKELALKPKPKLCGVCDKEQGKYKCPRCGLPYCSVVCFRIHKENHPPDPPKSSKPAADLETTNKSQKRTAPTHPFSVLDNAPELEHLFRKYPHLPSKLNKIHAATLPPKDEMPPPGRSSSSQLPWTLAQAPGYEPYNKKPKWTHDTGLKRGKAALRKARTDPSEEGDAVREYCELVLHLLSRKDEQERAAMHVTDLVRQQVTQEDVKLIEKLMETEGKWA